MKLDKGLMGGSSALLVLSLLSEKDYYGYEIIRTLEERSNGTFERGNKSVPLKGGAVVVAATLPPAIL